MTTLQTYRSTDEDLGQHRSFNKQRYHHFVLSFKRRGDDLILLRGIIYVLTKLENKRGIVRKITIKYRKT